ncbi:MAG: chromosomal replication initiator protein DnaA [Patescibacteria group bacterium]
MTTHELWQAALGELELSLSKANYTTWFRNTFISAFDEGRIVVSVPNTFTKAWFEKKYHVAILKALQNVAKDGGVREVHYKVELKPTVPQDIGTPIGIPSAATPVAAASGADEEASETTKDFSLNPRYTFENFIVGKTNELAHAAALAVTEKPGRYNPLFVYGASGLGKTHLLQAIGHKMIAMNPRTKVLYVTCERFTNEFIHAVRNGRGKEFKDTYRNLDLLLVDDFQFISGKESTQEEFFHTFNALHQCNKQIILSSDRPPKAIPDIEQRLVSRCEWGMMVDVSAPELETRVAILESKCKEKHYEIPRDMLSLVASSVQSNVRELEGTLNKIIAYHQFKNIKPSMESIRELVSTMNSASGSKKNLTPKDLLDTVARYYDIPLPDLLGKCREKRLSFPRQIIMYLMREELNSSYPAIGKIIGGRDHTTAIHAFTKIKNDLKEDERLRHDLNLIRQRLYSAA